MHQEYMAKKNAGARGIMERMSSASDAGLLSSTFMGWNKVLQDERRLREAEAERTGPVARTRMLKVAHRQKAYEVLCKIVERDQEDCAVWHFATWVAAAKCTSLQRSYNAKLESRRAQIASVHGLFREFTSKLEGVSTSTPRSRPSTATTANNAPTKRPT